MTIGLFICTGTLDQEAFFIFRAWPNQTWEVCNVTEDGRGVSVTVVLSAAFPGPREWQTIENGICPSRDSKIVVQVSLMSGGLQLTHQMRREQGLSLFSTNGRIFLTSPHPAGWPLGLGYREQQAIHHVSTTKSKIAHLG